MDNIKVGKSGKVWMASVVLATFFVAAYFCPGLGLAQIPKASDHIEQKWLDKWGIEGWIVEEGDWIRNQDWSAIRQEFAGRTVHFAVEGVDISVGLMYKDAFEKLTGMKLDITGVPADVMYEKLLLDFAGGRGKYHIFEFFSDWMGSYEPFLTDLGPYVKKHGFDLNDIHPVYLRQFGIYKDRLLALPIDPDPHLLHWRKTIYDMVGLDGPPKTYQELLENAKKLVMDTNGDGKIDIYGWGAPLARGFWCFWFAQDLIAAYGGELFNDDWTPAIAEPEAVAAVEMMVELAKYAPPGVIGWNYAMAREAWLAGRLAQTTQWECVGHQANNPQQSRIWSEDIRHSVLPRGMGPKGRLGCSSCAECIGMSKVTKDKDAAFLYLAFMTSPEVEAITSLAFTGVEPSRISVLEDPEYQRGFGPAKAALASLPGASAIPRIPEANELEMAFGIAINEALAGDMTVQEALQAAANAWKMTLERGGYYKPGTPPPPKFQISKRPLPESIKALLAK